MKIGLMGLVIGLATPAHGEGRLNIPSMRQAGSLLRAQKWPEAAKAYRDILKVLPDNALAWFRLGYVLHADGKLKEAIKAHLKAVEYRPVRATAMYNLACAYALTGQKERALDSLRSAYRAGFGNRDLIQTDEDLISIRNQAGFVLPAGRVLEEMDLSDGRLLDYYLAMPPDYDEDRTYPVLLAFPPSNQSRASAETGMRIFWGEQAAQRGWIVLGLIKPSGGWMSGAAVGYMRELIEELDDRFHIEGGKFYIAGCSGGGASAFHVAMAMPDRVHAVLGIPAYPDDDDEPSFGRLQAIPVRMFCGGDDDAWLSNMERSQSRLSALGVDATLTVYPGERHFLPSLRGGGFAEILDRLRRSLKDSAKPS